MSDSESDSGAGLKRQFLSRYDVLTLVDMIKERPGMWCKTEPSYRDRLARDRCWREILDRFEPRADLLTSVQRQELINVLIKKWCNIRDSYRKYVCSRSKANCRPYIYADRLTFLDPMFKDEGKAPRKRKYKYVEKTEAPDTEDNEEPPDTWLNEVQYVDMEDESVKQSNSSFQSELLKDSTHDSTLAVLVNLLRKEEDEDKSFFKSILPAVRNLTDENKLEFRIEVMKLLKVFTKRENTIIVKGDIEGLTDSSC